MARLAKKPFVVLGVNSDTTPEECLAAISREKMVTSCFFDGGSTDGPIARKWGIRAWPAVFVIDADGVIRHRDLDASALDAAVDRLVAEASQRRN